jgi:hypothetical protein
VPALIACHTPVLLDQEGCARVERRVLCRARARRCGVRSKEGERQGQSGRDSQWACDAAATRDWEDIVNCQMSCARACDKFGFRPFVSHSPVQLPNPPGLAIAAAAEHHSSD